MKKRSRQQWRHQRWKSSYAMRLRREANIKLAKQDNNRKAPRSSASVLVAPEYFVLLSHKDGHVDRDIKYYFEFLAKIRSYERPDLVIDMSRVRRMVVDAALLFKAELSRLIQIKGLRIRSIPPRSERTQQVLKQTGIDKMLNLKFDVPLSREDVVHWRIAEGPKSAVDPNMLESIMADIEYVTGMASHPVYQGIIESMGNCVEHAYKKHPDVSRAMPIDPGWWVFQQVKDDTLFVVVCDLGIGVSKALPLTLAGEQGILKKLMHLARRAKGEDNRALLAAMEYGRSSTGEKQRGKGMRNAHAVVNDIGEGDFYAVSNRGCYLYQKRSAQAEGTFKTLKLKFSINGTILGWRLPLKRSTVESIK